MGLSGIIFGNGVKETGEGVKAALEGAGKLAQGIRSAITGKLPPVEEAQVMIKLTEMDNAIAQGQQQLNLIDAQSGSLLKGGWRPMSGWICVVTLGLHWLVFPFSFWVVQVLGYTPPPPPKLDVDMLIGLLFALLGLGGYRMLERVKEKYDRA